MGESNPLEYVSGVQELMDLHDYMQDDRLQEAIDIALKLIVKPDVPNDKARSLIVKLAAYSLEFRLKFNTYMMWKKGTENAAAKKNVYKGMYDGLDNLVDALKYLVK